MIKRSTQVLEVAILTESFLFIRKFNIFDLEE